MKVALYKPETDDLDVNVNLYANEVCGFIDFGCNSNCPSCSNSVCKK